LFLTHCILSQQNITFSSMTKIKREKCIEEIIDNTNRPKRLRKQFSIVDQLLQQQ